MGFKKTCGHTKQNTVQRKKKDVISATVKFSFFSAELFDQNCLKYNSVCQCDFSSHIDL